MRILPTGSAGGLIRMLSHLLSVTGSKGWAVRFLFFICLQTAREAESGLIAVPAFHWRFLKRGVKP
jgi:hypothetical protein